MAHRRPDARTLRRAAPALALAVLGSIPTPATAQEVGPARGALVVSGGGETTSHIVDRFIELAGGPDAPIVVVPTSGRQDEDYHQFCPCLRRFRDAGATNLTVMHTRDRAVADTEAFVEPLRGARGVWFMGGSHWLHTDAYLDVFTHAHPHGDTHTDSQSYSHSHRNCHTDRDAYAHANTDDYTHGHGHDYALTDTDCDAYSYAYVPTSTSTSAGSADQHPDADSHAHADTHAHCDSHGNGHT